VEVTWIVLILIAANRPLNPADKAFALLLYLERQIKAARAAQKKGYKRASIPMPVYLWMLEWMRSRAKLDYDMKRLPLKRRRPWVPRD
jgi:hypothetical protein